MAKTPGLPARRAALQMIDAVLRRGETLDQARGPALRNVHRPADRALARAIAAETLRWLHDCDALIDTVTQQRLADDAKARNVLRLMLVQWLRLDTPPHAVIATGLPLLGGGPRRLAHGVFSSLVKKNVSFPQAPTLPDAVQKRWGVLANDIGRGLTDPPPLDISLKTGVSTPNTETLINGMGGESLAQGHVRLPRGTAVEALPGFDDGDWWVQDLAARLPAALLGPGEGRRVLDLCAAPGGKTMQLAANGWRVTAVDNSKRRLAILKENLKRTGLSAETIRADALTYTTPHKFDAVLIDAPCTATGTCRRHPDVLHRIDAEHINHMTQIQEQLLHRSIDWLNDGGVMVYAVCSQEEAEGEQMAAGISLPVMPISDTELPEGLHATKEGWVRTHPGLLADKGGLDGFFIARWRKP